MQGPESGLSDSRSAGFTLIELLIVILIIGILVSMVTMGVRVAQKKVKEAEAKADIQAMVSGLKSYQQDEGLLPGFEKKWDEDDETFNAFPDLFEALLGESHTKVKGAKGGRNAPYFEANEKDIVTLDDPSDVKSDHSPVDSDSRWDPDFPKYLADPWDSVYIYRENNSKKRKPWMHKPRSFDLWSCGPNRVNQSLYEIDRNSEQREELKYDDISNWN